MRCDIRKRRLWISYLDGAKKCDSEIYRAGRHDKDALGRRPLKLWLTRMHPTNRSEACTLTFKLFWVALLNVVLATAGEPIQTYADPSTFANPAQPTML